MTKRMLIDDTQPEETRVVIVDGNKVEDVEFESSCRKQIKGNIYTAKVIRVEPSLQAAFVDYGGNKHGFLAFSEIHPDYYNIAPEMVEAVEREVDEIIERKKQYIKEREEQREKIASFVSSLQQPDGSFSGDSWGEIDTRFSYCAVLALTLLGKLEKINKQVFIFSSSLHIRSVTFLLSDQFLSLLS